MRRFRKSILLLCIFPLLSALFAGCGTYRDVNELFVVMGASIDKDETGRFVVYLELAKSTGGKETEQQVRLVQARGVTVFDAIRNSISSVGAKPYWGHTLVFLISDNIAKDGIVQAIDMISRQEHIRSDIYISIIKQSDVDRVFELEDPIHESVSEHLMDLFMTYEDSGKYVSSHLFQIIADIQSNGLSMTLPLLEIVKINGEDVLVLQKSAVFLGEAMVGTLDEIETRCVNIIKKNIYDKYALSISNTAVPNSSVEVKSTEVSIETAIEHNLPAITVNVIITCDISELQSSEDYFTKEKKALLEAAFADMLTKECEQTVQKARDLKADVFGFGDVIHIQQTAFWKSCEDNWPQVFANSTIVFNFDVTIDGSKLSNRPVILED